MAFTPLQPLADWPTALASLAGWPQAQRSTRPAEFIAHLWIRFRNWQAMRTTAHRLSVLDSRTLTDIGISRSEIESLLHDPNRNRKRRYDPDWWRKGQ